MCVCISSGGMTNAPRKCKLYPGTEDMAALLALARLSPSLSAPRMIKCNWNRIYEFIRQSIIIYFDVPGSAESLSVRHLTDLFYSACFGGNFESFLMDIVFNIHHLYAFLGRCLSLWTFHIFPLLLLPLGLHQ